MSSKRQIRLRRRIHLRVEELEPRTTPATFNVSSIGSLLSAIQTADSNTDAGNRIVLAPGGYMLSGNTSNEILIQNPTTTAKTLSLTGGTEQNTAIVGGTGWQTRIFEISGSNLTVKFENLTITGGNFVGTNSNSTAQGGGMLIDSGNVMMTNVAVTANRAGGAAGSAGAPGVAGRGVTALNGGHGGNGGAAEGGGIYLASGSLTLTNANLSGNRATGGNGGNGGNGTYQLTMAHHAANGPNGDNGATAASAAAAAGNGGDGGDGQDAVPTVPLKIGGGGDGGDGGDASGGGLYVASGQVTITNSQISNNTAQGGAGGHGGLHGLEAVIVGGAFFDVYGGGAGGIGGNGGGHNMAGVNTGAMRGGNGGNGGKGGKGGNGGHGGDGADGGDGGSGGNGGNADGGGIYLASGMLTVVSSRVDSNTAQGGNGGVGTAGGPGGPGGAGGPGGHGGQGGNAGAGGNGATTDGAPGRGGAGGDAGIGGDGGDEGDAGKGGKGGAGGDGGGARGGGVYVAGGTVTILLTNFDSNKALGGNGANGANGGPGGAALETTAGGRVVHFGGAAGGFGETGGPAGHGGANLDRMGMTIGHGPGGHGGQGGNGGNGGGGGMGGDGGDPGDGGSGGDGLGGGIFMAGGSLTLVQGSMTNNQALGGAGGNGGAGGPGGAAGIGGSGGAGGNGGPGLSGANVTAAGGHGGNGGNGGDGGDGGNGGRAGHAGNGGNGEGGDVYAASGFSASLNRTPLSGTAQGGKAGAVGALGAGGSGGMGGQGGRAGVGGVGNPIGASGTEGGMGNDGSAGTPGMASGPASDGTSFGDTVFGTVGSETMPPTALLSAASVTSTNAGNLNPYTFTVTYTDPVLVNGSSISGAVVQVQMPNGSTIMATPGNFMLSGIQDGQGDAQTVTVTYQITPPGGSWSSAPNGTYIINLVSNPPIDLAGNAVATGTLGSFTVNVGTTPAPPVINSISPQTVANGTMLQFTVMASSPTGAPVTYSLGPGAPAGASINPQTGQFTWTPSEANGIAPGVYNVTVTATEATAPPLSSSTTVSITVGPSSTSQGSGITGRQIVASGLAQSAEYYRDLITTAYQQFLGRAPDTVGLASWLGQMQNHVLSDQRLDAAFTSSAEYLGHHGGAGQGWITSLYQNLLNRTPGASEVQYWLNQLAAGESPASVAYAFANSVERQSDLVASYYQQYLHRSGSPAEINGWVNQLENGSLTNEQVIAAFVSSQEYYQERGGDIVDWLYAAYRSVLNREPDTSGYQSWLQHLQ